MADFPKYQHIPDWRGLRVAVLGYGVEGQSSVRYLLAHQAKVTVYDDRLASNFDNLDHSSIDIDWHLGDPGFDGLADYDWIIRSPGIQLTHLGLETVSPDKITSQTELFLSQWRNQCVGVTGSKGKGTTVTLLAHLLRTAGRKVVVGGNIGQPMLDLLTEMDEQTVAVMELSSFQLQDIRLSPALAIMLMITPEHLQYHGNVLAYIEAKWQLLRWQQPTDQAIINTDYELSAGLAQRAPAKVWSVGHTVSSGAVIENDAVTLRVDQPALLAVLDDLPLRGRHNLENVAAAGLAGYLLGLSMVEMGQALKTYQPLPHHLTLVHQWRGITFYDDSFATTPEAAVAAIQSFDQPLSIIVGGSDKGSDYSPLVTALADYPNLVRVVVIGEVGPIIAHQLQQVGIEDIVTGLETMSAMVQAAIEPLSRGGVVLLSPSAASFGLFKDYKDRGDQFIAAAKVVQP